MLDNTPSLPEIDHLNYDALPLNSRHRFAYYVANMADGSRLALPVMVMVGTARRPRLVCVAGVHGNEHEGITALLELWGELPNADLQGTLVMVPVANPPAFRASTRRNPEDMVDMNRIFPGQEDGSITERLAYHLFHGIVLGADFVLSMHGWSDGALVLPYTEYPQESPVTGASLAAARIFGLAHLEAWDWPYGLLCAACNRAGIPAIEPEIGGLGCTVPERRALYKRGVRNLMKHLGMQPGTPEVPLSVHQVKRTRLFAPAGGVLHRSVELGAQVNASDEVAAITDLTGRLVAQVNAPVAGFVAAQTLRASVNPGDSVAVIFQL